MDYLRAASLSLVERLTARLMPELGPKLMQNSITDLDWNMSFCINSCECCIHILGMLHYLQICVSGRGGWGVVVNKVSSEMLRVFYLCPAITNLRFL